MPGLDALAGVGGAAEQLFIWSVLSEIISHALAPYLQALDNRVLAANPNVPLSPAFLAGAVVRGHISEERATEIAKQSGVPPADFHTMVVSYGSPLPPEQLAAALRRGFIQPG